MPRRAVVGAAAVGNVAARDQFTASGEVTMRPPMPTARNLPAPKPTEKSVPRAGVGLRKVKVGVTATAIVAGLLVMVPAGLVTLTS